MLFSNSTHMRLVFPENQNKGKEINDVDEEYLCDCLPIGDFLMISTTQSRYVRLICEYPDAFFLYLFIDGK